MRLYTLSCYDMVVPDYTKEIHCLCVCMCVCIVPMTCASLAYVRWYKLSNIRTTLLAEFRDGTSRIWKSLTDFNINELIFLSPKVVHTTGNGIHRVTTSPGKNRATSVSVTLATLLAQTSRVIQMRFAPKKVRYPKVVNHLHLSYWRVLS